MHIMTFGNSRKEHDHAMKKSGTPLMNAKLHDAMKNVIWEFTSNLKFSQLTHIKQITRKTNSAIVWHYQT